MDTRPAIDRLLPLSRTIGDALRPDGADAGVWFVGGVLRDALLDRPLPDIDLVVSHGPERVARSLGRRLGGAVFPLSDRHGSWRITLPARQGIDEESPLSDVAQIDVCELRDGSLEADLSLRDFTINAMAAPLADPAAIIDLHGGLADLAAGRVSMVSAAALDDDPLRMLRAVRFAHTLDGRIDDATVRAIRQRSSRAVEPAGERTFAELCQLVESRDARVGLRLLADVGLESVLLPELAACDGMAQSPFHHLDVREHTLAVLDNTEDLVDATDFWFPLPPDVARPPWTPEQRRLVRFAALCHDLGKPATRTFRADGRVSFIGHDSVGADVVHVMCDRWRTSSAFRSSLARLVATHLLLGFLLHTNLGRPERWRFLDEVAGVEAEAVVLSMSDRLATAGPADRRRWVRAHLALARTLWVDHWRTRRDGVPAPLLDGLAIAAAAGIDPGPAIGPLVRELARAQWSGTVTSMEEARDCVRRAHEATAH